MKPDLFDPFTVHSSSYLRPSIRPIRLDRGFNRVDTFTWHGHDIACIETHGNSPAGMTYLIRHGDRNYAMSGDLMVDGARMYDWFDSEWDYCFGRHLSHCRKGSTCSPLPSPTFCFRHMGRRCSIRKRNWPRITTKLRHIERLILRTYRTMVYIPTDQDRISKPTPVPNIRQVLPHLYKFRGANYVPNFSLILSDSGHALVIDCGRVGSSMLDESLKLMKERLGLKQVDAVIITHMHGDHCTDVPHLRDKWGAQVWTLDRIVDKFEHPLRYDYAALIESYGVGVDSFTVDRGFKPGEILNWEGFTFTVDHMPGQTLYALSVRGIIDGQSVVFTGDNIFGNTRDPNQNGHDAVSSRNQAIVEEGYIVAAEYLTKLKPDLIMGGHSWVMDRPAEMVERYRKWAYDVRDALHGLSGEADYYRWFDPFWVRAEPYRVTLHRGESAEVKIHVRNFQTQVQSHRIEIDAPPGFSVDPPILKGTVPGKSTQPFTIRISAGKDAPAGVSIIAFDILLDGHRYGEMFDMMVEVEKLNSLPEVSFPMTQSIAFNSSRQPRGSTGSVAARIFHVDNPDNRNSPALTIHRGA